MEILHFTLLVIIGAFIGWITNKIAIKMLFRPINPHKILGVTFQGVFPRRKDQMAVSLADIIEKELLSKEVIMDQLLSEERIETIKGKLKEMIIEKLVEAIPPVAAMLVGGNIRTFVAKYMDKNGDRMFDQMIDEFRLVGFEGLNIREIVKKRIDSLDFAEFEKIIFGLMNKELRFVETIGLFLGALIGVVQYFVILLL